MKKIFVVVLMVAVVALNVQAAEKPFDKADANRDGKLDRAEFDKAVEKKFRGYDKDGNGVLDMSEIRDVQKANKGVNVKKEFKDMDSNKDGKIDLEEFKGAAAKRFKEYDRNGDGVLDRPEVDYRTRYQDPGSIEKLFSGFYF